MPATEAIVNLFLNLNSLECQNFLLIFISLLKFQLVHALVFQLCFCVDLLYLFVFSYDSLCHSKFLKIFFGYLIDLFISGQSLVIHIYFSGIIFLNYQYV